MKFSTVFLFTISIATFLSSAETLHEVRITEFLANNESGIEDEDGDRSDWIEIWNASGISGELGGWYLTDDPENLAKWQIPGSTLAAGGRVIVFASAKNRAIAGNELHTSFKLQSEAGGYLALVRPDGVTVVSEFDAYPTQEKETSYGVEFPLPTQVGLLGEGAMARWMVPSGEIASWTEVGFDDGGWSSGTTGIGYDSSNDYVPHFGGGDDLEDAMRTVNKSVFIRIPFTVTDPAGNDRFLLRMKWEDGFAAYLNGVEITRQRSPESLSWDSGSDPASGRNETDAVTYFDYEIVTADIRSGTNILAIHGLNQSLSSSDFLISPLIEASKRPLESFTLGHFTNPTPGAPNDTTRYDGLVADTKFSTNRGVYDTAFNLTITTTTPGATIRYTTDGSVPSEEDGIIYSGLLQIDETTVVRAMAYRANFFPTNVDTHTYIFPADVVTQPTMRTAITGDPVWGPLMVDSINALPTLAFSMPESDINYTEIPISVELLNFENGDHQIDAGARRVGGRFTAYEKRSFRLHFRSEYGPKRLNYPVFDGHTYPTTPVESFDALDVRAGNQDMIHRGAYLSNFFTDDSMLAMGNPAPHGRFVHVYFNGNYRGMYHLRERFHSSMLSDYSPGSEEEYTTIDATNRGNLFDDDGRLQNGPPEDWNQILGDLGGPTPYRDVRSRLDVPNLIDFMLLWTSGSCESEFRAVGSPANGMPFVFHMKDADGFLRDPDVAIPDPRNRYFAYVHVINHEGPINALSRMRSEGDADFETLVADRIHKHYFNDGVLTAPKHVARLRALVDVARLPYLAESARWAIHDGDTPARDPNEWEAYQQNLLQNLFPGLPARQITKLRAIGYYPDTEAPVFSQHGGSIPIGSGVVMTTPEPHIYYTQDGSDPRLSGGSISPAARLAVFDTEGGPQDFIVSGDAWRYLDDGSNQGAAWRAAVFDDSTWLEGPSELGYGEGDEETEINFVDREPDTPGNQRNATSYFRKKITIANPAEFFEFTLGLKYDDAAAIYVNGSEVVRTSNLSAGATFDTYATSGSPDETTYFGFTLAYGAFVAGENTIAVEIHNASSTSGDLSFDLRLRGEVAPDGSKITEPLILSESATLKARSYDNNTGEWSALNSAFFSLNSIPASADNLVVSEIHYHPAEPIAPGEIAVSTDRDDFEFIEFLNIAAQPIELAGVSFTDGIEFSFGDETLLEPGRRLVLVGDAAAFAARYGDEVTIFGEYSGRLSNGGERLALSGRNGVLLDFSFDDVDPWPTGADGEGSSIYLVTPGSGSDPSAPTNWMVHGAVGGAPGSVDFGPANGFSSWKIANSVSNYGEDHDGDGLVALMEYALGSSPNVVSPAAIPKMGVIVDEGVNYPTLEFALDPNVTDIVFEIQSSVDLENWEVAPFSEEEQGVYRSSVPLVAGERTRYFRLSVQLINE